MKLQKISFYRVETGNVNISSKIRILLKSYPES